MEAKILYIKKVIDGNVVDFPSEANPAVISTYTYDAKRMGGTPTITATISYERPLDDDWSKEEYVEFNGEKYYVTSTPSSSKANDSIMYKHEVTFTSGREVLDNTLFFDVVTTNLQTQYNDRYRSNKSDFTFGGNIREFVDRINSSLAYCNIYRPNSNDKGYYVVIDEGFDIDDVKELSFSDQYITEVLQLINTEYGLEYYWVGSVCHVGKCQHDLTTKEYPVLRYGRNDALLSIGRENSNSKVVDMVTGYGSSDNIQYYYPNDSESGDAVFDVSNVDKESVSINLGVLLSKYPNPYGTRFTLCKYKEQTYTGQTQVQKTYSAGIDVGENDRKDTKKDGTIEQSFSLSMRKGNRLDLTNINVRCTHRALKDGFYAEYAIGYKIISPSKSEESKDKLDSTFIASEDGVYTFTAISKYTAIYSGDKGYNKGEPQGVITLSITGIANIIYTPNAEYVFACGDKSIAYDGSGIVLKNHEGLPHWECSLSYNPETGWYADNIDQIMDAASVTITDRLWLEPTGVLMPSIYRATGGANRFYYAKNNTYKKPDGSGEFYEFKNIYDSKFPHQGSYTHDDIKPTIRGIRNDVIQADGLGQLFGEIADVAFDKEDSDMVDSNGNYIHSYFYIKLHKFSGDYGFSLFDSALSTDNAKIEMIESQGCPACSFAIGCYWDSKKNKCYNNVLTDGNGNLKSEIGKMNSNGDYILNDTYVEDNKSNQDSTKEELWICVQKDNSTLGVVIPNASAGFKPKKGDKFVITGIKPPKALTLAAEKRLEEALIKDMYNDNEDKFNYTIKFSRIFLQENPDFSSKLNENARVVVEYNGHNVELFTSNYSVKVDENALASVEVELVKSLDITESSIKQAIDAATNNSPIVIGGQGNGGLQGGNIGEYLSRVSNDTAQGFIKFLQGLQVGSSGEYRIDRNGVATLYSIIINALQSIDYNAVTQSGFGFYKRKDGKYGLNVTDLLVWGKAIFHNLEIRNLYSVGGAIDLSPSASRIVRVEEVFGEETGEMVGWKCYLLADDGTMATTNQWMVDDQARCQTFNIAEGVYQNVSNKNYWRRVTQVSKTNEQITDGNGTVLYDGKKFAWIVLSKTDCMEGSDVPSADDVIVCRGNRTVTDRQHIIVMETVGEKAPSVTLYHGINSYSFANKEYVEYGVNKQTDKAFFNVYGDLYIGDRPTKENGNEGKSYIRYDSAKKLMEIKAKIDAKSTIGDRDIDTYIRDNTLSSDDVKNLINNSEIIGSLQNQIDGAIETWYYDGKPTLENLPAQGWNDDDTKNKHIGDLYYDKSSGKAYRFLKDAAGTYMWVLITDEDITKALALAGEKKRIFGRTPIPPYDVDDLWVYAVYPSDGSKYNKEILRCITAKSAGEQFSIDDWALASDYATNTKVAQLDYLKDALKNDTVVDGGLILSTLIALRDKSKNIQSGINGAVQDATYKGGGIAAWYGGEMGDIEDKSNYPGVTNWAKSLLRFDGSGYLANGNVSWGAEGKVSIKDLSALINTDNTDILNVLSSISSMFSTRVKESEVLILPQLRFGELFINRLNTADTNLNNNDVVLTQGELKDRFVTIDWFNKVFSVVDDKKSDLPVNGNISSGASIHAKMSLWSDGGISALGNSASSGGSGGGGGLDADLLWSILGNSGTEQISKSHLSDALAGYATEEWVESKGYLTNRDAYTKEEIDAKEWSSNKGTVTSVGITMPTGFSVSGSPITEKGILAIGFATGYSLPTTAKQSNWDTVYNWYSGITGSDTDTIINKWGEIISFLDGIEDTATLSGIVNGINQSITAESNRAKGAEQTLTNNVSANATAISDEVARAKGAENTISSNLTAEIDRSTKKDNELSKSITDEVSRAKAAEQTLTSSISTNTSAINVLKGYFTNGVANSAVKLQTARKIWGNIFDGTQDVAGDLILPNGKKIVIGGASLSWDADNNAVKIDGSVYATGGLSALGNSDVAGGGGGGLMGSIVPYSKAITLTVQNEGEEIASAWSVKMLYDKIENVDVSGQLTSYLTKQEAQTLYQPVGNYLTEHQDISGKADRSELSQYLPLTGGTLTGYLQIQTGADGKIVLNNTDNETNWNLIRFQQNGVTYGELGTAENTNLLWNFNILWHTGNLTKVSQLTNDTGFITSAALPTKVSQLTNDAGYVTASIVNGYATQSWVSNNYLPLTGGTLTGTLTANKGLVVQGRVYGSGDDEGIIINASDNGLAGVILGSHDSNRGTLYFNVNSNQYFLCTVLNGVAEYVHIPCKTGTMALTSQIPTNNNQLTNGAGYITSSGSCAYATSAGNANNADKLDGLGSDDILPYGLENLCAGAVVAGGNTTLNADGSITTTGVNSDTYFFVRCTENLTAGQIYTVGFYVTGVPLENTSEWWWPLAGQTNTNLIVKIKSNGWCWGTGTMPFDIAAGTNIIFDDTIRGFYNSINISKFVIVKGRQKPYYTPPISKMSVASATKLQTARTIWGQSFDGTGNIIGTFSCDSVRIGKGDEIWSDANLYLNYGATTKANVLICADGGGNVGIGTHAPSHKLHVIGDMATTGRAIVDSLQIGNITISYDSANKGLRIAGGGLYTDSYLSSLGVDASTALSVKKWADSINLTEESDAELATAYSIGNLYRLINSNQESITQSLNQSVSALQGRCTSLEQRVSALENKVNK